MFCKHCGKKISDDAVFCNFCGAKIEHTPETAKISAKKSETESTLNEESKVQQSSATQSQPEMERIQPEQKEKSVSEVVLPAQVKGFLDPSRLKGNVYPVEASGEELAQKTLKEYYFKPDFYKSAGLGRLKTGRQFFWELVGISLVTLLFFPRWVALLEILCGVGWYYYTYKTYVYNPGVMSMAETPHYLPTGMSQADAEQRIQNALLNQGISVERQNDTLMVEGVYPLCVENGTFHIGFPEDTVSSQKSNYCNRLAELNIEAARALFPERMQQPLLPAVETRTVYKTTERIVQVGMIVFAFILMFGAIGLWETPADQIQDTYWEDFSSTKSLGEAFNQNYKNVKWEDGTIYDEPYVQFSGMVPTSTANIHVQILFGYDEETEVFQLDSGYINEQPVTDYTTQQLMQYGYDGDKEALVNSILAEGIVQGLFDAII